MDNINLNCITTGTEMNCIIPASDPFFTPFFSSGDIMISVLLFILVVIELIKLLRQGLNTQQVIRNYQGNNSPDGKEFYKI